MPFKFVGSTIAQNPLSLNPPSNDLTYSVPDSTPMRIAMPGLVMFLTGQVVNLQRSLSSNHFTAFYAYYHSNRPQGPCPFTNPFFSGKPFLTTISRLASYS